MANADDYKKQQDLLFQEIEEKLKLATQARETGVERFFKSHRKEIRGLARAYGMDVSECQKRLKAEILRPKADD